MYDVPRAGGILHQRVLASHPSQVESIHREGLQCHWDLRWVEILSGSLSEGGVETSSMLVSQKRGFERLIGVWSQKAIVFGLSRAACQHGSHFVGIQVDWMSSEQLIGRCWWFHFGWV